MQTGTSASASASASASFYKTVYDTSLPTNATSSCLSEKTSYNTTYNDLNAKLTTLRNSTCLENETKYSEEIGTLKQQTDALTSQYETQRGLFDTYISSAEVLQNARGPFDTYMRELTAEKADLEKRQIELQQQIRAGRRRFIDDSPQDGVTSVLGQRTTDDKVLLTFWICFTVAIVAGIIVFLLKYGQALNLLTVQQKVVVGITIWAFCVAIAGFSIRRFA